MARPLWKTVLRSMLHLGPVNLGLRTLLKPFRNFLPDSILLRLPVVGQVRVALPGSKVLRLHTGGEDEIAATVYWKGVPRGHEPEVLRLFLKLLQGSHVLLDIGANTGLYGLIAAIEKPNLEVYAFEPVPRVLQKLERNRRINGLANLEAVWAAVSDYDGEVQLHVPEHEVPTTASTLPGFRQGGRALSVPATTIDTFVAERGIGCVDLIKTDTEGTEDRALAGARKVLERDEPVVICEVLKGRTEVALQALLERTGYRFFLIAGNGLVPKTRIEGDGTYRYMNYLFVTDRRMPAVVDMCRGGKDGSERG